MGHGAIKEEKYKKENILPKNYLPTELSKHPDSSVQDLQHLLCLRFG